MPSTPQQLRTRARFETLIGAGAPVLDLVLAFGDRVSKLTGPEDEPIPIRPAAERLEIGGARGPGAESD